MYNIRVVPLGRRNSPLLLSFGWCGVWFENTIKVCVCVCVCVCVPPLSYCLCGLFFVCILFSLKILFCECVCVCVCCPEFGRWDNQEKGIVRPLSRPWLPRYHPSQSFSVRWDGHRLNSSYGCIERLNPKGERSNLRNLADVCLRVL